MDQTYQNINLLAQPIPIAHLPLRRSTAALLRACGFNTVKEVYDRIIRDHAVPPPPNGSNDENDDGSTSSCCGIIMRLAMEFRHQRRNMENGCISGSIESNSSMMTNEETTFAENVYVELMDAVTIVTQEDDYTTTLMNSRNYRIGIGSSHASTTRTGTARTAADLLRLHQNVIGCSKGANSTNIITFCRALDELLDGGIAIGELTELAGSPGSGKTTMCMQLAVNAALPHYCGGVNGRTVYIDTEGSFSPERCFDLATHLIQHVQTGLRRKYRQSLNNNNTSNIIKNNNGSTMSNKNSGEHLQHEWNVTAEDILNNILVYRAHDVADLAAIVHGALPALLASSSSPTDNRTKPDLPIRLVIVDSIAFPYRAVASPSNTGDLTSTLQFSSSATTMDYATRTQHLNATAATLTSLSVQHQLAVVAVNQMTTKFTKDEITSNENNPNNANAQSCSDSSATQRTKLIPALGESWAHTVTSRLILNKPMSYSNLNSTEQHQYRTCSLTKSPRLPSGEANLVITNAGIRGMEYLDAMKTKRARTSS